MQISFKIPGSLDNFFSSEKFISLAVGPYGSLKTTVGLAKILYHASRMAPCVDGVRRSRAVWVRNTREQLQDTSIPDFLKWYPDGQVGAYMKSEGKFVIRVGDIECEVLFRGLDEPKDVRRLLSLNASFGILDEFREINSSIYTALQSRLGRYPDGMLVPHRLEWGVDDRGNPVAGCVTEEGKPNAHLWGMSNPPDMDTFWEELLSAPPENVHVTIQPSALSPEADWVQYLPPNYYENLIEGKTQDWIDVYVHAKFGKSLSGQPVFRSFNRDLHVAKERLRHNPIASNPLMVGVDCGLNPAAAVGQLAYDGRLLVFDSMTQMGMGALRFIREHLRPLLVNKYPGMQVVIAIDPAGFQRSQTDERTVAEIFKSEGFAVKPAPTNVISARISAVDFYLTRMIDGRPGILIDPGCGDLIKALAGRYRYKIKTTGEMEDKPEKNHPWSDIADAFEYLCLYTNGGAIYGGSTVPRAQPVQPSPYRWAL